MGKLKYRVYHYYADENRYDHIDIPTKERAIAHWRKSRTAQAIYEIIGNKTGKQVFPHKRKPLPINTYRQVRITPKRPRIS